MHWIKVIFVILFCASQSSFSQKMELGEVTMDELKEKRHPKDTAAAAAVLFKKAAIRFYYNANKGFYTETNFEYKIKIYKKEGLNWANFVIPYYTGSGREDNENIEIDKAVVYNVESGKIVKSKVSASAKVDKSINEFWDTKTIIFPNVKAGSIIELKYKQKSSDFDVLPQFQFQYEVPLNAALLITEIPDFYKYKIVKKSDVKFSLDQKFESASQNYNSGGHGTFGNSFVYRQINSVFKFKDVPALIEEEYAGNINNFYGKIEHELEELRIKDYKSDNICSTWEDVGKLLINNKRYQTEIQKNSYFINDLKVTLNGVNIPYDKMTKVFDFVKRRMVWNEKNSLYLSKPIETAYDEKTGNSAEINFILLAMLRMSGIEADPVFLTTKYFGYADYPNRSKLNYVIVAATIDGKKYLLDATDKLSTVNMPPIRTLNWFGREVKKDGTPVDVDLFSGIQSKESVNMMATLDATGEVKGMIKKQNADYYAYVFRDNDGKLSKESYLSKLEKEVANSEINDYTIDNATLLDKPVVETFSFKNQNSVEIIGDKILFSPLLFFALKENPFRQEKREYPVDFIFPNQKKYVMIINIPDGYVVDSMPKTTTLAFSDQMLNYKFNISSNGKQIQIVSVFDVNTSVLYSENYEELKKFFSEMIKKQTEKVVLKKA